MSLSDELPSSPAPPGPDSSLEESLRYYKAQYETLAAELADFQNSSKELEAELEKDIEASEKRERHLKDKAANLQYEVEEWKTKYNECKREANSAQNVLQKEITELRDTNRSLHHRLRDTEVANDDIERQQRNTESSLEDMESKYNQTIERSVMLEEEMRTGEQEREALRIETQRLRDDLSDLKIEADITKEKLRKAEETIERRRRPSALDHIQVAASPHSEISPTTTDESSPSFDTPPGKTASSSGLSDTPTPPSPPMSEKSAKVTKPFATPILSKIRPSINANTTPRQSMYNAKPNAQVRDPPFASATRNSRITPSSTFRQSVSRPSIALQRQPGLPQSTSILHLRNLRGKMQKLEERVQTAKSKLPAPIDTPPKASPRSGPSLGHNIPASVTVRSSRKRLGGSTISDMGLLTDQEAPNTPIATAKSKPSRSSLSAQLSQANVTPTPIRGGMAAPPPRPGSRASMTSRSSINPHVPGHSRPGSRASISSLRSPLGSGAGSNYAPNASTDRVRPQSSLSNRSGFDGALDEENDENVKGRGFATPTPRRTTIGKRVSDVGSSIPSPTKRLSVGPTTKLPTAHRRQSSGFAKQGETAGDMRPPSRQTGRELMNVQEDYDIAETF